MSAILLVGLLFLQRTLAGSIVFDSRKLEDCTKDGLVRYPKDGKFKCYFLFEQGPCQRGQWLIMDGLKKGYGDCQAISCPPDEVLIQGRCHKLGDPGPCSDGKIVHATLFGYGECDCERGYTFSEVTGSCIDLENVTLVPLSISDVPTLCEEGQGRDKNGNCVDLDDGGIGTDTKGTRDTTYRIRRPQFLLYLLNRRN